MVRSGYGDNVDVGNSLIKKLEDESDGELKSELKNFDTVDFNIGLKDVKSNTMLFLNICNQIKENNPDFKLEDVRKIFAQSFQHLFKNQDVPMTFTTAIQQDNNKFYVDRKIIF